jgi:hypothetical protein
MNHIDFFADIEKEGKLCLYVPRGTVRLEPPKGATTLIYGGDGSFIAGEKHHEKYAADYAIYRDSDMDILEPACSWAGVGGGGGGVEGAVKNNDAKKESDKAK